jgi:hypothetical protein
MNPAVRSRDRDPVLPTAELSGAYASDTGARRPPSPWWFPARGSRRRAVILVGVPLILGVWHVYLVSSRYFVGSFDDDASYLLTAQALLHGSGLTGHLTSGASVVGAYPPGYSFLLVPLLWIWPHTFAPERIASAVFFAAVFPLAWVYLGRRRLSDVVRFGTLLLMALNPVMATFGSMVMAETSFLVLLTVLLLAVEGWDRDARVLGPRGIGIVVAGAGLVWLKEAGIGIVIGLGVWYALRRDLRKAAAVVGGCALLLVPVVVARAVGGVPLEGSRYSEELGGYYSGGLVSRLVHVVPSSLVHYFAVALPASVVPQGSPLPNSGAWSGVWSVVGFQVSLFTLVGLCVAIRRYRDAALVAVPVYVAETLLWPEINERRVILVLPVILAWYVLGVVTAARWALAHAPTRRPRLGSGGAAGRPWPAFVRPAPAVGVALLGAAVIGAPLVAQFPRDYLFGIHTTSSQPGGSRYMSILAAVGQPSTVVETDYESTTALFTGHRTANTAFLDAPAGVCQLSITQKALAQDDAGYLLIGTLNKPRIIDNACLFYQAASQPFAVRLLRTNRDQASVFELIGPGTAHADVVNLLEGSSSSGSAPISLAPDLPLGRGDVPGLSTVITPTDGQGEVTWNWGDHDTLDQVSVGEVKMFRGGTLSGVTLEVQRSNGTWVPVADAPGVVGDNGTPYLLGEMPAGTRSDAMRLVVRADAPVVVTDVNALGTPVGAG